MASLPTGDAYWPVIYFSHLVDREEYCPPEGVDLEKWLTDHKKITPFVTHENVRISQLGTAAGRFYRP